MVKHSDIRSRRFEFKPILSLLRGLELLVAKLPCTLTFSFVQWADVNSTSLLELF